MEHNITNLTPFLKKNEITRDYYLVDAKDKIFGRLVCAVSKLLMGKTKSSYAPHLDAGDFVVVINASKIKVTGKKRHLNVQASHQASGRLRKYHL